MIRDEHGERLDPRDVLAPDELADYYAHERGGSYSPPRLRVLSALDEDGRDAQGFEWGAR